MYHTGAVGKCGRVYEIVIQLPWSVCGMGSICGYYTVSCGQCERQNNVTKIPENFQNIFKARSLDIMTYGYLIDIILGVNSGSVKATTSFVVPF